MSPRTTPRRSSSYRHSLIACSLFGVVSACVRTTTRRSSPRSARLEDFLEQPLPFLLLFPGEDSGNDFLALQPLGRRGRVDRHVGAGLPSAPLGEGFPRPA